MSQYEEDLMYATLEVFNNVPSVNMRSFYKTYFNDNPQYPLFKEIDVQNALQSHFSNKTIEIVKEDEYKVTKRGINVYSNERKRRIREREEKELQFKKLKYDLSNSQRVYKTYRTTRIITWVTFIVTIILSLLKLAETLHIWPYHK